MLQEYDEKAERRLGMVQGLGFLTWLAGVYPLTVISLVVLAWTIAWMQLGHTPRYWVDDPQQISSLISVVVAAIYMLAVFWVVAALISTLFWSIGLVSRVLRLEGRFWPIAIPPLAWGALVGLAHWDPGSVLKWLAD